MIIFVERQTLNLILPLLFKTSMTLENYTTSLSFSILKRDSRAQFEMQNITPNLCGCL